MLMLYPICNLLDKDTSAHAWTSDSEDDSSQSPSENSYTSDTDISSSSTCSSSSCDEAASNSKSANNKRPLIEEISTDCNGQSLNPSKTSRKS